MQPTFDEQSLILALDQGGSKSRALLFDTRGTALARGEVEVATEHPAEDRVEQDPEEIVRSLRRAVREAHKHIGRRAENVVLAGLATQRSSVVAWDRTTGVALTPVISWQDRRAQAWLATFAPHEVEIRALTGLRLSPHYGASKLAWCLANVPVVRAALDDGRLVFGPLASFLAFRLLEERPLVADPANASRTLLFGLDRADWEPRLLERFGIPLVALPQCVPSRHAFGSLDTGKRRVPLVVLTGDQSAALFATGEPRADTAYVNFGTGAFVQRLATDALVDVPRLLKSLVHDDGQRRTLVLEGTVNGAGSALSLAVRELGLGQAEPDIEGWLAREMDPPLYLNGVGGLAAPYWIPDFASRFVGEGTSAARVVAVLESIVFLVDRILTEMSGPLPRPERLVASGGLAQSNGLCRRLADLTGLVVERTSEPEATARGLAHLVRGAAFRSEPRIERFEPHANAALLARRDRWRTALES